MWNYRSIIIIQGEKFIKREGLLWKIKKDEDLELDKMKRLEKLQSAFNYSIFPKKEEPTMIKSEETPSQEEAIIEEVNPDSTNDEPIIKEQETSDDQLEDINEEEKSTEKTESIEKEESNESINFSSSNKPKYDGYKERIIRYSLSAIIALAFLLISIIGYNNINKQKISIFENSMINYSVCQKENQFYEDECLGEGNRYASSLTDKIRINYIYNAVYQKKEKKKYEYYVKSRILFKTGKNNELELFKKEDALTKKQQGTLDGKILSIKETIDIPFQDYNEYALNYKKDYPLVDMSNLEVSLIIKEGNKEKELSTITIPLKKEIYSISKKEISNKVTKYSATLNKALLIIFIICIVLGLIFTVITFGKLVRFLWQTRPKKTPYQKKLSQILKKYDKYIVNLENHKAIENSKEEYTVISFQELLDVKNTIKEPILFYKVNDVKSEFYVQDKEKTYKYIIKESDFEEK